MGDLILIADDEAIGRKVLEAALVGEGHELVFAEDGASALELARTRRPDLALLDVMMPGMDGIELCRNLRGDPALAELPILLITALDDRETKLAGLEAGADDFLTKPLDRAEIRARVRSIMKLNRYGKLVEAHRELVEAYDATLEGWVHLLDLRDKETEGHTRRVTRVAVALGKLVGIHGEDLTHLRRGALLHDIGKMGIPDCILQKPGPLDAKERAIMEQHPQLAMDMLSGINFLEPALAIPYCHHERVDGLGYPRGLVGEAIPYAARLFSVVDVWDALAHDRVYREAWPREQVTDYLRQEAGHQLDAKLVDAFLQLESTGQLGELEIAPEDSEKIGVLGRRVGEVVSAGVGTRKRGPLDCHTKHVAKPGADPCAGCSGCGLSWALAKATVGSLKREATPNPHPASAG